MRDEIEIMRVLRLPPMGKLTVEAKNQRYGSLTEIPDQKMQQLVKTAVGELISFVGGYQTLVEAGVAPPLAPAATTPTPAPPAPTNVRPVVVETAVSPPASNLNIVDGINTILTTKLAKEPTLANQTVKLIQDSGGGLQINVNDKYYEHPGEIEEEEIRELLQQALQEWENS